MHTIRTRRLAGHPTPYIDRKTTAFGWGRLEKGASSHPLTSTNVVVLGALDYRLFLPRLSIDISPEDHQKLKAIAALKGQSIKGYVLDRVLGDAPALDGMNQDDAFKALTDFLEPRIDQARRGQLSGKSLDDIRREEHKRAGV